MSGRSYLWYGMVHNERRIWGVFGKKRVSKTSTIKAIYASSLAGYWDKKQPELWLLHRVGSCYGFLGCHPTWDDFIWVAQDNRNQTFVYEVGQRQKNGKDVDKQSSSIVDKRKRRCIIIILDIEFTWLIFLDVTHVSGYKPLAMDESRQGRYSNTLSNEICGSAV